jgi:hypothetical protein
LSNQAIRENSRMALVTGKPGFKAGSSFY